MTEKKSATPAFNRQTKAGMSSKDFLYALGRDRIGEFLLENRPQAHSLKRLTRLKPGGENTARKNGRPLIYFILRNQRLPEAERAMRSYGETIDKSIFENSLRNGVLEALTLSTSEEQFQTVLDICARSGGILPDELFCPRKTGDFAHPQAIALPPEKIAATLATSGHKPGKKDLLRTSLDGTSWLNYLVRRNQVSEAIKILENSGERFTLEELGRERGKNRISPLRQLAKKGDLEEILMLPLAPGSKLGKEAWQQILGDFMGWEDRLHKYRDVKLRKLVTLMNSPHWNTRLDERIACVNVISGFTSSFDRDVENILSNIHAFKAKFPQRRKNGSRQPAPHRR